MWLTTAAGIRLPITPAGVLLGRSPHCDVVLTEGTASRVQAIVFAGVDGPCVSVLGKGTTAVNGESIEHDRELASGDRLSVPGLELIIGVEHGGEHAVTPWLVRGPGGLFGVVRSPFVVGAGAGADLRTHDGPDRLLRFFVDDGLAVEALASIRVDGCDVNAGESVALAAGGEIVTELGVFQIVSGGEMGQAPTLRELSPYAGPRRVKLAFLARGGRLTFDWHGCSRDVYLPERRCDLIAALLRPPSPFVGGDFVPDDVLLPRVWPGRVMSRVDLNTVLHRARQDLARAVADGGTLLARAEGGNATRFVVARDADISIA
jgi:hypothetical protein